MAAKKYNGAPFGTQTARFDVSGVHPKSKMPGTYTEIAYDKKFTGHLARKRGPGCYEVRVGGFALDAVDSRASGPGWARAYEVERMAALPHLLHKDQWEQKRMLVRKLGPGSYEFRDFIEDGDLKPRSSLGICQTKAARFQDGVSSNTPGPGTYGKGGVPHAALEDKAQRSASTKGILDGGPANRGLPSVGCHIAPGTYNFKSFTEELSDKVTSLRGPFDVFSGDRNKPIREGHFAAPQLANLGPGQYELQSFVDEMGTSHKTRLGRFGKMAQYPEQPTERIYCSTLAQCPKQWQTVGPGQYEPGYVSKPQAQNSPGFLSSAQRNDRMSQKFFTRNFNPVGAGRYDIQKWDESQHRNGHSSVFRSRTGKYSAAMEKFMKERIRGKDLRPEDRSFLVEPEVPANVVRSHTQTAFQAARSVTVA